MQVHKLTYVKQGTTETIEGKWVPAPNQTGNCGFGTTFLTRRSLVNTYPSISKNNVKNDVSKNTPVKKITPGVVPNKSSDTENTTTPQTNQNSKENIASTIPDSKKIPGDNTQAYAKLEKRKNNIIKTIQVESSSVKVDLYDNGEIDGDSISLFFNKILLLTNKKLSDKPLSMILDIDEDEQMNELVMYAENLGSIPPNTALMIVTDGTKRYEVRITSDLEKSGVINFVHKKTSN